MLFKNMALYKKTVSPEPPVQEPIKQPTKKRKSVKQKRVSFTETVYEHPPALNQKQRMYTLMFPDRNLAYCMQ